MVRKLNAITAMIRCSLLILIITLAGVIAEAQVQILIQLPPPGSFNPEDFIQLVSFDNTSGSTITVTMSATVEEENTGLVFSGTTTVFELSPGFSMPHYSVYEPIIVDYVQEEYETYVLTTNSLPSGSYIICIKLFELAGGTEIAHQCIPHSVYKPSAPMLVYPADQAQVAEPLPVFSWLPPSPMPPASTSYTLRVVELLPGQQATEALTSNPPFLYVPQINETHFLYRLEFTPFIPGNAYAWQVQAVTSEGVPVGENGGLSETGTFIFGEEVAREIQNLFPVAECTGNVSGEISSTTGLFQWMAKGAFTSFQVIVYANPCGQFPPSKPSKPSTPSTPPTKPTTPPATPPTKPVKPPVVTPVNPVNPVDSPRVTKPVITTGGQPDTTGGGVTLVPGAGITDWPDEGETELPPLPPGWAWGEGGAYWTGEHPPTPPDLPPGWEWGPLRPVWVGEGTPPPERRILGVSTVHTVQQMIAPGDEWEVFEALMPLGEILQPGQAFIYQVYGVDETPGNEEKKGCLSETQCLRYTASADGINAPKPLACDPCATTLKPLASPAMDGGLDPLNENLEIDRDGFIPLKAVGADFDEIWWYCTPKPLCPETSSKDMRATTSRVKFEWAITEGEGDFVEIGCLGTDKKKKGNRVIFMPPYVKPDSTKTTKVKLSIIDDNPSQPLDKQVDKIITIKTERARSKPDQYKVTITSDGYTLPIPFQTTGLTPGTCTTVGPDWTKDTNLTQPNIKMPEFADSNKLVFKEFVRLYADDIRDPDNIRVTCKSASCPTKPVFRDYEDDVEFEWSIKKGGGNFIKGNKGRFVIYQAGETAEDVDIEVQVYNPAFSKIADKKPAPGKITLKVFQPGVRIEQTPMPWLPVADNVLSKKSYLVHKDQNTWEDGLAHQCRIHFIEMTEVSKEPGICLNWPPKNHGGGWFADTCPDLSIKNSDQWELFDTIKGKRWNHIDSTWFLKANSLKPVKEMPFDINSYDYGSYGFIKSMANGDKSITKPYESVPWEVNDKKHPDRPGDTKPKAADNRVTIPRDGDENKMADNGWQTTAQQLLSAALAYNTAVSSLLKEKDPALPAIDTDTFPKSNFPGDGISCYEEYRGFFIKGTHQRFGIGAKDLLIWDRDNTGLGYLPNAGITCWLINQHEMDIATSTARVINLNRKTHSLGFNQKGIRLFRNESAAMSATYGWAVRSVSVDGLVSCDSVLINVALNNHDHRDLGRCIAHELSHSVGVRHHGEGILTGYLLLNDSCMINGAWRKNTIIDTLWYYVAGTGGVTSGDIQCWMRYVGYIDHCPVTTGLKNIDCTINGYKVNMRNLSIVTINDNVVGATITNITAGNGVNASGQCGQNAGTGRGQCADQIRISCRRP